MTADGPVFEKFIVERMDGEHLLGGKHHGCFHFVLDIDHDPYAREALRVYAVACRGTHPRLSQSLMQRLIDRPLKPKVEEASDAE